MADEMKTQNGGNDPAQQKDIKAPKTVTVQGDIKAPKTVTLKG